MSDPQAVTAAKAAMRSAMKARRSALPEADRNDGARRLAAEAATLLASLSPPPATVSGFLAIGDEIDPLPSLDRLHGAGYRLALPVMAGKGKPLVFRAWAPGDTLETVTWGIREPQATSPEVEPDALLVPLLAFDRHGHRLGYGGGFFDRTLRALRARKPIAAIGIAFTAQEVDAVPHLDYDETLDWVLTPEGPIRTGR